MNIYSMTKLAAVTASVLLTTTAFAQQDSQKSLDYSLDTGNVEITPAGETSTIQKDEVEDDEPFLPIFGKEASVSSRDRYIAIWRGMTIVLTRFLPRSSETVTW